MKNKILILLTMIFLATTLYSQDSTNKHRFPLWTFYDTNTNIHGVSLGLLSHYGDTTFTNTNGIKLEILGLGFLIGGSSHIADSKNEYDAFEKEPISEYINGIYLSGSGAYSRCQVNGILAGIVGNTSYEVNGITLACIYNEVQKQNGIIICGFNHTYVVNGLQIGFSSGSYIVNPEKRDLHFCLF